MSLLANLSINDEPLNAIRVGMRENFAVFIAARVKLMRVMKCMNGSASRTISKAAVYNYDSFDFDSNPFEFVTKFSHSYRKHAKYVRV